MATQRKPVARVSAVSYRYGQTLALDNVSIDLASGRMLGLIGPDGVGKSTLLGLLAGARRIQEGTVDVLGGSMGDARHRNAVFNRIAYMPQGLGKNLYQDLSVYENLDFFGKLFGQGADERSARIARLLKATGLDPFPDRPAGKLSGGMKQKLGLCCALIHDPDFLILDEPTTGVDPLARRQFWELIDTIRAERSEMSVLVSTAYMDEAERFEDLIAMDAGRVLATGTPDELKATTGEDTLERAFVSLLPEDKRKGGGKLEIPPYQRVDGEPAIVAKRLTRRFGTFTAVDNVSFEIEQGEIFGFLGSNGCGKTTTMKMLTGLLPASEGEAWLFGEPIDANNIETRKRVGFMSQSFSLYGELTVLQNLKLHARLFHLPAETMESRIPTLISQFGLEAHENALASELPLGLSQRLSLAVAIIHEPELLILDEPTSGVDPVARDEFWKLLIDLSRRDLVTIFLSTHFMNEGMRCDRVSLMHAGKVLVSDTPEALSSSRGATSFEDAFIIYIAEAIGEPDTPSSLAEEAVEAIAETAADTSAQQGEHGHSTGGMKLRRLLAYSHLESLEVMRDPVRLAFAFLGSVILLLIFGYGISSDVRNLTYAAFDLDQTPESRAYLANFSGSTYFRERPAISSKAEMDRRLSANDITLAIEIPPGFGAKVKSGGGTSVSAWIDGASTIRAATIEGYVQGAHVTYLSRVARDRGLSIDKLQPIALEPRYRYNPSFESVYSMGPSVPAILLLMFPSILMAVSIAREKEIGTITNFYVTPTTRLEFLVGKQLPYIAIGFLNYMVMLVVVIFLFGVPLKGSFLALTIGTFFYVSASTAFGLLVSSLTRSQVAAVFAATILSMLPTVQFSGLLQPVSTLEGGARIIGSLWPTTYYMHLSVGAYTKGLGFADLAVDIVALAVFVPVFVGISALALKKQEG